MAIVSIVAVLLFSTALSLIEVPKMLRAKSYKELAVFSGLLALGTGLAILKSLNVQLPNPSDWVAWIYSPVAKLLIR